ncbi:predicted protein [Histoplasma capsulatum var. duboisii H88]|uniref:Predicted protein n=1 Tax=Ajellomyces capsulatus (strain H88) TaxID=544711 RepID=F0UF97_AJEC8|nr:predicted protein [Histoplasma capsulatum var. duboisii H88]
MFYRAPHISLPTGIPYLATTPSAETRSSRHAKNSQAVASSMGVEIPITVLCDVRDMVRKPLIEIANIRNADIVTDLWANDRREAAHKSSADQTHPKAFKGWKPSDLLLPLPPKRQKRSSGSSSDSDETTNGIRVEDFRVGGPYPRVLLTLRFFNAMLYSSMPTNLNLYQFDQSRQRERGLAHLSLQ